MPLHSEQHWRGLPHRRFHPPFWARFVPAAKWRTARPPAVSPSLSTMRSITNPVCRGQAARADRGGDRRCMRWRQQTTGLMRIPWGLPRDTCTLTAVRGMSCCGTRCVLRAGVEGGGVRPLFLVCVCNRRGVRPGGYPASYHAFPIISHILLCGLCWHRLSGLRFGAPSPG